MIPINANSNPKLPKLYQEDLSYCEHLLRIQEYNERTATNGDQRQRAAKSGVWRCRKATIGTDGTDGTDGTIQSLHLQTACRLYQDSKEYL